jgi:Fic family protein
MINIPYYPVSLPLEEKIDRARLVTLISEANRRLGKYDGLLQGIVNPTVLLSPLTQNEAVLSSKIEGTQATLEEVLEYDANPSEALEKKESDIKEVQNYRSAILLAKDHIAERPITLSFILSIHQILMEGVRGETKKTGEFRKTQNWIGSPGSTLETATFVPPDPLQLRDHLENWANYLSINDIDPIVQTAIVHAQFELIHPFLDGNGRIGRLLIPLFLYSKRALSSPMFYLSEYLEKNRTEYYERLSAITKQEDWNGWIEFFLRAVTEQANSNINKVMAIMKLFDAQKTIIPQLTNSKYATALTDGIFAYPVFSQAYLQKKIDIPKTTLAPMIKVLTEANLLKIIKKGSGRSPAIYCNHQLLQIVK